MAFVLMSAVGLAALRSANDLGAGMMVLLALIALGVAVLGAALVRGRGRAWWMGFAVFCGGYLALSVGPWVGDPFRQQLLTTHWIGQLRTQWFGSSAGALELEKQALETELARLRQVTQPLKYDPVTATMSNNLRSIQTQLPRIKYAGLRYDEFQRVGHCLLALMAGLLGETVATWFYARRNRAEIRARSLPLPVGDLDLGADAGGGCEQELMVPRQVL